jgi:Asp/Glu/hydantoin racemase
MTYFGSENVAGGRSSYGCVAGILSLHSTGPRLPGDPVHAQTFDFPVCHAVVDDVTIRDLLALDPRNMDKIVTVAKSLEDRGVRFIATSCGLFAPFQKTIGSQLGVPFLSSSLQIVTFLKGLWTADANVCVFTAHSDLLREEHLRESGFSLSSVVVKGMQDYPEFARITLDGGENIDPEKFRQEVRAAAQAVKQTGRRIDLAVLECPNLITFRSEIQQTLGVPVFDVVNLVDFFASGYRLRAFSATYV